MNIFLISFYVLCVLCALLYLYTRSALPAVNDAGFNKFQNTYLVVYLLAMAGDWLQGPHVYALYESYGMTVHQIEILFVAGFGSSMIVGTVVGSFADRYGRRFNCILYGILYGLACVTKHFNNFWILMVGRLLGGTATSILYSAFESWLIHEHNKVRVAYSQRGFDSDYLGNIFSLGILGNSLVAIIAGIVAQWFADRFGFVAPFDVSLTVLVVMCIVIAMTWSENYGNKSSNIQKSMSNAVTSIKEDFKVLCLGLIQSLFEGSMYVFVLEWTPALTPEETTKETDNDGHRGSIPHGHIFAGFMVSIMIGSSLFKLLSKYTSTESFMRAVLMISAVTLATPVVFPHNHTFVFIAFLIFEVCVGIFWPSMSTMRGKYVPEETRATVMNIFRVPLNLIVVLILLQNLDRNVIFQCCVVFLIFATVFQHWLYKLSSVRPSERLPDRTDEKPLLPEEKIEVV